MTSTSVSSLLDRHRSELLSVVEPLSPQSALYLEPVNVFENDRMEITMAHDDDGRWFFDCQIWAVPSKSSHVTKWPASTNAAQKWPKKVPERKALPGSGCWRFARTDMTAVAIQASWPASQLIWKDERAKKVYEFLLLRFSAQSMASRSRAEFKIDGRVPDEPQSWIEHQIDPLSPYQKVACWTFLNHDAQALFMEQGTGKTPCVINRICYEARLSDKLYTAIVVCPKNVRYNWTSEIRKFATCPGRFAILKGGKEDRLQTLIDAVRPVPGDVSKFVVVLASYETMRRSIDALKVIPWNLAVLDESHYIKGTYTKRWGAVQQLRDVSKQRTVMTGTPIPNALHDLYAQLEFLGEGLSGFSSPDAFRNFYSVYDNRTVDGKPVERLVGYQHLPMIQERLARLAFMVTKKEALPFLPEKTYTQIDVPMTEEQYRRYVELRAQLAIEIEQAEKAAEEKGYKQLTVSNALVKLLRLAQITSGFYRWDLAERDDGTLEDKYGIEFVDEVPPKSKALLEVLANSSETSKIIVWATFVADIEKIASVCRDAGYECVTYYGSTGDEERQDAVARFNSDPKCKLFIGNPAAGGTGVNLLGFQPEVLRDEPDHWYHSKYSCDTVVYYSQNWSSVERAQSEDRAHRRGTRNVVNYVDLVVVGSIDEEIRERVVEKRDKASKVQDVSELMQKLLAADPDRGAE